MCVCEREREKGGRLSDFTTTSVIDTARGKTICHMLTKLLLMLDLLKIEIINSRIYNFTLIRKNYNFTTTGSMLYNLIGTKL